MRKIEVMFIDAIKTRTPRVEGNTEFDGNTVRLHGHRLFTIDDVARVDVDLCTLTRWPTATTKSRLNNLFLGLGLHAQFFTRDRVLMVSIGGADGVPVASFKGSTLRVGVLK